MLIIGLILFGMLVGAAAQLILNSQGRASDWVLAFAAGLIGSFVALCCSACCVGDGIELRPSGIIGSLIGAVIVTAAWKWWQRRRTTA